MRRLVIFLLVTTCCLLFIVPKVRAVVVNFSDNYRYWPGWQNGTGDDGTDSIGIPDLIKSINGGSVTIENDQLKKVEITYTGNSSYWDVLFPGDLFIDTSADDGENDWDYLVKVFTDPVGPAPDNIYHVPSMETPGSYALYNINGQKLNDASTNSNYIMSGNDGVGNWDKDSPNNSHYSNDWKIRDDHPVSLDVSSYTLVAPNVGFSGWPKTNPSNVIRTASFDLSNAPISLGYDDFIVGFGMNCANDVIYERIDTPTPEPSTILLLLSGLFGLGILKKKRQMK
jgi:hypothetical protein